LNTKEILKKLKVGEIYTVSISTDADIENVTGITYTYKLRLGGMENPGLLYHPYMTGCVVYLFDPTDGSYGPIRLKENEYGSKWGIVV
jgi:hypothetical protein